MRFGSFYSIDSSLINIYPNILQLWVWIIQNKFESEKENLAQAAACSTLHRRQPRRLWNQPPFVRSAVNFNATHNDYHYDFGCFDAVGQINFISYSKRSFVYNSSSTTMTTPSSLCSLSPFHGSRNMLTRTNKIYSIVDEYIFVLNIWKEFSVHTHTHKMCVHQNAHARMRSFFLQKARCSCRAERMVDVVDVLYVASDSYFGFGQYIYVLWLKRK